MKIVDLLSGTKVLEEVESEINGKISVIKTLGYGTYLQVGGLTQSGGVVYGIWKTTLRKVKSQKSTPSASSGLMLSKIEASKVKSCLILGLGGGTSAELIRKFWPGAEITGVDLDPAMVELGKKYFGLRSLDVDIVIGDAYEFVVKQSKSKNRFDLILVDIYLGDKFPKKFEEEKFLKLVFKMLSENGCVIFNRLYFGEKRKEAVKFGDKLDKVFSKVRRVYPEANLMF